MGKYQLRVWTNWRNGLRVDFTTPSVYRTHQEIEHGGYKFEVGRNILSFRWRRGDSIGLFKNGSELFDKTIACAPGGNSV
jgi:hypothetical protein